MQLTFLVALLAGCGGDTVPLLPGVDPSAAIDPGTRTLGRLNATEFDTTVRDLFGTELRPGVNFPADETAYGFDNIASVLTTTTTHVELWEGAADSLLDEMFGRRDEETQTFGTQAEAAGVTYLGEGMAYEDYAYALFDGSLSSAFSLPYDGTFNITVQAFGRPLGTADPTMEIRVDGEAVGSFDVTNELGTTEDYVLEVELGVGVHTFEVAMVNPYAELPMRRTLVVDHIQIEGPTNPQIGRTDAYDQFVPCALDGIPTRGCAADAIETFGKLAWRRPLVEDEANWALELYDLGLDSSLDEGEALQFAFKGLLMSPEFLYRLEQDPEDEPFRALDGYEVATRLAAFAWSSTPDEALLTAAADGLLDTPEGVQAELGRLLTDDRSQALVDNLAGQWFSVRKLGEGSANAELYPEFDTALRESMQQELSHLLKRFFRDGETLPDVLLAEDAWIDQPLADLYLVPLDPSEDGWGEASLIGTGRVGLFSTAGWLAANSRADGPSAVKRGKWIIENLLCSPPPPPPPDVEGQVTIVPEEGSVREQEELQRGAEYCQGCHSAMDPLGFVLWGFDGMGAERFEDELGYPIDNVTQMGDVTLSSVRDLSEWVVADPRLPECVVEKTLTYALGRPMRTADDGLVGRITADFVEGGQTFDALAAAIVKSDAFRLRGAPEVE